MPEEMVWSGTSSQWKNFGMYFLWALAFVLLVSLSVICSEVTDARIAKGGPYILLLLIVPIFIALARYLQTKNKVYELTTERLKTTEGVFSKVTDTLELYRVKDLEKRHRRSSSSKRFPRASASLIKFGIRLKRFAPKKACAKSTSSD